MATANIGTPANAIANMSGVRPNDAVARAVQAFFDTGNTKDAATACGQTHDTLKTNLTRAFKGSAFGLGLSKVTGKY